VVASVSLTALAGLALTLFVIIMGFMLYAAVLFMCLFIDWLMRG
jgi:hypothetical protein